MKTRLHLRFFLHKLFARLYKLLFEGKPALSKSVKDNAVKPFDLFIEDSGIRI